jgi:phosphatidylserine/phosphatidylglycerophosphate/cardiolipin synthase-like enzyme
MPHDGVEPIVALIDAAKSTVKIKMFTFFDSPALFAALKAAYQRGVAVRVMLNPRRSSGTRANDETADALRGLGITVAWTSPRFAVTHEKSMIVDDRTALVATFNFVDKYFTRTRDYGVVVDDPRTVMQIADCFEADWRQAEFALPGDSPLALGNSNARYAMAALIDGSERTLRVQHPKYSDLAIIDRLLQARARGIHVHLICGGHRGISESDKMDTFSGLRSLRRAGVHIRRQHRLRLHAKLIIADGQRAMLGSMNIDRSAFDLRRELGVVFSDEGVLQTLLRQFHRDWKAAKHYDPPDPLAPPQPEEDDIAGADPDLEHE